MKQFFGILPQDVRIGSATTYYHFNCGPLYTLNIKQRCIKTTFYAKLNGNTLVKVSCRYDQLFWRYGLVKLKYHGISENLTFDLP